MNELCTQCRKNNRTPLRATCRKCRVAIDAKRKLDIGLCIGYNCQNKHLPDKQRCRTCLDRRGIQNKEKRRRYADNGKCTDCGKNNFLPSQYDRTSSQKLCQTCYLKTVSKRHFGHPGYHADLLNILQKQGFKCAYSGEILILGENDSLDHILSQKRHPGKSKDLSNVQWTTREINKMKSALSESRFLDLCTKVSSKSSRPFFKDSLDGAENQLDKN